MEPGARFELPDDASLSRCLSSVLEPEAPGALSLIDRKLHPRASTFPLEVVRCRLGSGRATEVVCKYAADGVPAHHGHRGGVHYEAAVYREVLRDCGASVPGFHGLCRDPATGCSWLVLDHLRGAHASGEVEGGLIKAASWLGRFQASIAARDIDPASLHICDSTYLAGWAERTVAYTRGRASAPPWLRRLSERFIELLPRLVGRHPVVIHGEYYWKNVLVDGEVTYPVDWESAALGPGEIDLASLTENWPTPIQNACIGAYREARWPNGTPEGFELALDIARAYWLFRWVGETAETAPRRLAKRLARLHATARCWGIVAN